MNRENETQTVLFFFVCFFLFFLPCNETQKHQERKERRLTGSDWFVQKENGFRDINLRNRSNIVVSISCTNWTRVSSTSANSSWSELVQCCGWCVFDRTNVSSDRICVYGTVEFLYKYPIDAHRSPHKGIDVGSTQVWSHSITSDSNGPSYWWIWTLFILYRSSGKERTVDQRSICKTTTRYASDSSSRLSLTSSILDSYVNVFTLFRLSYGHRRRIWWTCQRDLDSKPLGKPMGCAWLFHVGIEWIESCNWTMECVVQCGRTNEIGDWPSIQSGRLICDSIHECCTHSKSSSGLIELSRKLETGIWSSTIVDHLSIHLTRHYPIHYDHLFMGDPTRQIPVFERLFSTHETNRVGTFKLLTPGSTPCRLGFHPTYEKSLKQLQKKQNDYSSQININRKKK